VKNKNFFRLRTRTFLLINYFFWVNAGVVGVVCNNFEIIIDSTCTHKEIVTRPKNPPNWARIFSICNFSLFIQPNTQCDKNAGHGKGTETNHKVSLPLPSQNSLTFVDRRETARESSPKWSQQIQLTSSRQVSGKGSR
jgi:hypothetical protein